MSAERVTPMQVDESLALAVEPGVSFCPECGQSLDLSPPRDFRTQRQTLEPIVLIVFGCFLAVAFALHAWNAHATLMELDRQIAANQSGTMKGAPGSSSDQRLAATVAVNYLQTERPTVQQSFDRDLIGLALGALTLLTGTGTWVRQKCASVVGQSRAQAGSVARPSSRGLPVEVALALWTITDVTAKPLLQSLLIGFVALAVTQLLRGEPPTIDLLDRTLTRMIDLIFALTGALP